MRMIWLLFVVSCFTAFGQIPERPSNPPTAYNEFGKERFLSDADAAQIEEELRTYNELFLSESQPARLRHLREIALELMADLAPSMLPS